MCFDCYYYRQLFVLWDNKPSNSIERSTTPSIPAAMSNVYKHTSGNVNTFEGCFPSSVGKPRAVAIARVSLALGRRILMCTNVCDSHWAIYQCTILLYCLLLCYWNQLRCYWMAALFHTWPGFRIVDVFMRCLIVSSGFHETLARCMDNMKRVLFFSTKLFPITLNLNCGLFLKLTKPSQALSPSLQQ